ncbi:UDP-glycosyltransferase UGT5-like [Aethina tumida]|uniref:UDP-glycosyltransferase UGT5-like n=1 Tax=Aethina tumida TaxID=116153 RepID=UPI00214833CF|nr:UDP-glycosyltransferase UGT5-like [Aethina tumida]
MFVRLCLIFIVTNCLYTHGNASKILCVFNMASPSHYILGSAYAKALAEKGHDVTVVSPFEEKNPPKNGTLRSIVLTGFKEDHEKLLEEADHFNNDKPTFAKVALILSKIVHMTEKTLQHPNFQELINSDEKFDVVVIEQFFNDALKGLASHFDAPLILFNSVGANNFVNPLVGNPSPPSYIPDMMQDFSSNMSFFQRVKNTLSIQALSLVNYFYIYPAHGKLMKKYIPRASDYTEVIYNASLVFLNSDPSINMAVPKVPCMIDIGGLHVQQPKQLPADLKAFLDGAKEGVIYFSMGSNLRSKNLPIEKRQSLLNVFSKLKLKILWKWEDDVLPGQPKNVKLNKWLPQPDVLAHPNVKLFITHGGYLSTTEAIYHGKPVLAIPVFADQFLNSKNLELQGYGKHIPFIDLNEENLSRVLDELLNNPEYARHAQRGSKIMRDKIVNPKDAAVYWTEYVIRHQGASHLKVAGVNLPLYKYLLLDVYLFLTVVVLSVIYLLILLKRICRRLLQRKSKKD